MMEVKQNTAVDLNDLLTMTKDGSSDEVDDVMTGLSSGGPHDLVNCDLMKPNDATNLKMDEVENGGASITSLIKDVDTDVDVDLSTTVNSELEDALLAEDDILQQMPNNKTTTEAISSATDDILAEKTETSNSTTSSNNVRDPGDDLDTLLSKINDIVEDCIDNESENVIGNSIKPVLGSKEVSKLNDECISVIEKQNDDKNLIEKETLELDINNMNEELGLIDAEENLSNKDALLPSNSPGIFQKPLNNVAETANNDTNKKDHCEKEPFDVETEVNNVSDTHSLSCADNEYTTEKYLNKEKTEETNAEIVQDNKVTSNNNEVFQSVKTTESSQSDDTCETTSCPKDNEIDEEIKILQDKKDSIEVENDKLTKSMENNPINESIASLNIENDDSDDDIVFYVDKPPETEKPKENKSLDLGREIQKTTETTENAISKEDMPPSRRKTPQDDDEVVLLLDDDEEEIADTKLQETNQKGVKRKSQDEQRESAEGIISTNTNDKKDIVIDNSDNARDDFATENSNEEEKIVEKTEVTETADESNSNCSNSSNLLQEAKSAKDAVDEPTPEEIENEDEEEDGDGEVEVIENEIKESENLEKSTEESVIPPAKRIRLSEDGDDEELSKKMETGSASDEVESFHISEKEQAASQEISEKADNFASTHSTLKRPHDVIEVEADEKSNDSKGDYNEGKNKKLKTVNLEDDGLISEIGDELNDDKKHSEDIKCVEGDKKNIKAVPSYDPIRLYPAPNFDFLKSKTPISLDFFKKFRKSFDNMSKQDLEDLVLQKVVEAIIHRSEFSEMRELIEKQEKIISGHRTKISELSKQFRDLEMVHNRVVKDIEQRNSQFIMPVKITRAVGLQVYIPNKKSLSETPSSSTTPSVSSSPQRPVSLTSTSSTALTAPQRLLLSSHTETQQQRTIGTASSGPGNASNVRRGCVQKITPIRPVPGANQSASTGSTQISSGVYRANHSPATQPRILNKNATTTANSTAIQRSRYLGSNQEGPRIPTPQQISRTSNMTVNSPRVNSNSATQSKPTSNVVTSVQRRSEPLSSQNSNSSSSSIVDNYINTLTHLTGGNTAVSITPAKPKEKAVIDLTDEDETPGQSAAVTPVTQIPVNQVPRRLLPAPNNLSSQLQYGRAAPTLGRVASSNQMANNKNRQMSSLQGQNKNPFGSISTPAGTSITRINVASNITNVQRVKYSHPAPLPATPPQAFNPAWKLPPPRPTIRISNLDNGIVISWTMEESMDRHAECVSYQIYAYQETSGPPMVDSWRHVGDVKAMLLPMAVTLTQFQEGQRYYFAVRAVDCHQRYGPFSLPKTWS